MENLSPVEVSGEVEVEEEEPQENEENQENRCKCEIIQPGLDFEVKEEENEDLEEIEDDGIEDPFISHKIIWQEIEDEFNGKREAISNYKLSLQTDPIDPNPGIAFLEKHIFPLLINILECTIKTAKEKECIKHQKNVFNGIDYIAEMLQNLNPLHPERKDNWTYIFDMDWVVGFLSEHPRPFYPFSWVWSREWATTLIQAHMRAHWVKCRKDVQEMRQFWRIIQSEDDLNIETTGTGK